MTSKKAQNIQIAEILSFFTLQTLKTYSPAALKQQLLDLRALMAFSQLQIPKIYVELRKKANELTKIVNQIEKSAAQMQSEFFNKPAANYELAYRIMSMSAAPLVSPRAKGKIIKELKVKFLQSNDVTFDEWHFFFRKQRKVLAVSIPEQKAQVVLGVQQKESTTQLEWVILEASIGGQRSPELFVLVRSFWVWSSKNHQDHSKDLIANVKKLLFNLPLIIVYLELKRVWKAYDESQSVKYSRTNKKGAVVNFQWKFNFFQSLSHPKCTLNINDKQVLEIFGDGSIISSQLIMGLASQSSQQHKLCFKQQKIPSFHHFINLPEMLQNFNNSLQQFEKKGNLLLGQAYNIIVSAVGLNWVPLGLISSDLPKNKTQGVWIYLPVEKGICLFLQEQGILSNKARQRGLLTLLAQKGAKLADLGRHICLQEQIHLENNFFQFQLYQFKIDESNDETFVQYEFRSMKSIYNQKYHRLSRMQQAFMHSQANFNENHVITVKIALDFTKVLFSSFKFHEGKKVDKTDEDVQIYMRKDWKNYKEQVEVGSKLSWIKVAEAIGYLCRCLVPERLKHRRAPLRNALLDLN